MANRKIKIFPKSIVRIELHAKFNRLFVQCINDPLIYTIETTSAVVIQTVKYSDHDHNALLEFRNSFTVSPCGSLLFVKSPNDDQLKCIRLSNEEQIAEIRVPISLTTRKYSVTSLAYHPNKNLMVCSIFGDSISSSLLFMCNEADTEQSGQPSNDLNEFCDLNDNLNQSYHALDEWQKHHEQEFIAATDKGIKSIAIDSILNRIDDLFFMAIRSPKQTDDGSGGRGDGGDGGVNDQFKEVQEFLEKIRLDSSESKVNGHRFAVDDHSDERDNHLNAHSNESSSRSGGDSNRHDSKGYRMLPVTKQSARNASQSDTSHHTFDVEPSAIKQRNTVAVPKDDDNEPSNATFSVQSDNTSNQSNLTFEIPKV